MSARGCAEKQYWAAQPAVVEALAHGEGAGANAARYPARPFGAWDPYRGCGDGRGSLADQGQAGVLEP